MAKAIHPDVRIGHVHLKVADLDRALAFYRDVLGFELTQRYGRSSGILICRRLPSPHRLEYLGECEAAPVRRMVRPACTMLQLLTQPARNLPMRFDEFYGRAFLSKELPITE